MNLIKLAGLSMALLTVPALTMPAIAQPISETHELHWGQAGKVPTATYRPIKQACGQKVSPVHLAGRTPLIVHAKDTNCNTRIAKADVNRAVGQE